MSTEASREQVVAYSDVQSTFHVVRALTTSASAATLVALTVTWDVRVGWAGAALAVMALVDSLHRRRKPDHSPALRLVVDAVVLLSAVLWVGGPALIAAPYAYLLTAALIVLPLTRALLVISYLSALVVSAQFAFLPSADGALKAVLNSLAVLVPVAAMAILLLAAGRALRARERQQMELVERARQANQVKSDFLSLVSHELRTPLTGVSGFLATLTASWRELDPAEVDEFLHTAHQEAEHLGGMVNDLLAIVELEADQLSINLETVRVRPLVEDLTHRLSGQDAAKQVSVTMGPDIAVLADRLRLSQVLRNLIDNARKYGGNHMTITSATKGECALITVSDNGRGIPDGDHERIFEPFERLRDQTSNATPGIGLGLPISRALARAMGGDLWCEPNTDTGTRFCLILSLPATAAAEDVGPTEYPQEVAGLRRHSDLEGNGGKIAAGVPRGS